MVDNRGLMKGFLVCKDMSIMLLKSIAPQFALCKGDTVATSMVCFIQRAMLMQMLIGLNKKTEI